MYNQVYHIYFYTQYAYQEFAGNQGDAVATEMRFIYITYEWLHIYASNIYPSADVPWAFIFLLWFYQFCDQPQVADQEVG